MLFSLLERAGNHALTLDPEALHRLAELDGRSIVLNVSQTEISLVLRPDSQGVRLGLNTGEDADVTLTATPSAFLRIASQGLDDTAYSPGELEITGDALLAQRFARILGDLDIDWEELLAERTGDVPARVIGRGISDVLAWAQDTRKTLKQNLKEYIVEETRAVPSRQEVERLLDGVDSLRADAERLELRVQRFQQRAVGPSQ